MSEGYGFASHPDQERLRMTLADEDTDLLEAARAAERRARIESEIQPKIDAFRSHGTEEVRELFSVLQGLDAQPEIVARIYDILPRLSS